MTYDTTINSPYIRGVGHMQAARRRTALFAQEHEKQRPYRPLRSLALYNTTPSQVRTWGAHMPAREKGRAVPTTCSPMRLAPCMHTHAHAHLARAVQHEAAAGA